MIELSTIHLLHVLLAQEAWAARACTRFVPCEIVVGGLVGVGLLVLAPAAIAQEVARFWRASHDTSGQGETSGGLGQVPSDRYERDLLLAKLASQPNASGDSGHKRSDPNEGDWVDVSAFAPEACRAGEAALVQIYLHPIDQAEIAAALAREADPETKRRGITTLEVRIPRLQRIHITLDAPGLRVPFPVESVVWRNEARACQFVVKFPVDAYGRTYQLCARVSWVIDATGDSVPLGSLRFSMRGIAAKEPVVPGSDVRGERAQRYTRAFLSYASPDRPEVLKRAQALKTVGIAFFQDILDLEPGERWENRLYKEIDECDLFLLFWSKEAADSQWVIREAEYALKRQAGSAQQAPDITPVILEGPPVPKPPPSLDHLHFNDALRYVMCAAIVEKRARVNDA
jgi:hypothetical protein